MPLPRIYDASAFDAATPQPSWWEESAPPPSQAHKPFDGEARCDVAIIGAGFTGLNAALGLARAGVDARVLEAGHIGWGASGRNGGFCANPGVKLSWGRVAQRYGLDEARRLNQVQNEAIAGVRGVLDEFRIDADTHSDGRELCLAHSPAAAAALPAEAQEIKDVLGVAAPLLAKEELRQMGADGPGFHGGMIQPWGFALHPLKYLRGLAEGAAQTGATLYPRSEVQEITLGDHEHVLTTPNGRLTARKLIIATNGYTAETIPHWLGGRLLPAQSSIIVTRPITEDEQRAQGWTSDIMSFDTPKLLHYFRLMPDGRFLFGGRGGVSGKPAQRAAFRALLRRDFESLFPAWAHIETTHEWSGHICMNRKLAPYVGRIDDMANAWTGLAYHGSGVAMASWTGAMLAELALGRKTADDLPAILRAAPPRFVFPMLRPMYLRAAYAYYRAQDRH